MSYKILVDGSRGFSNAFDYVIIKGVKYIEEKEINTLKAQLKREMAVTNMAAMDLPNQALELARETVKARGEFRKDE